MRVLVVHNRYRSHLPSGENEVVDREIVALRAAGLDVHTYLRSSDEIEHMKISRRITVAGSSVFGRSAIREITALVAEARIEVVHLHNVHPLISPAVIPSLRSLGVPIVHTVHNQRLVCIEGTCMRAGRACEDCVGHAIPWPALAHGCYRGSRLQTLPMAVSQTRHRRTWLGVDRYLAPSEFVRRRLERYGIPSPRIVVKPNFVPDPGPSSELRAPRLVFAGRLEAAKGIDRLLDAWPAADLPAHWRLVIAGDGPMRARVEADAAADDSIEFVGRIDPDAVGRLLDGASCAAAPSRVAEAGSLAVLEALARGVPIIVAASGALPELAGEAGWVFDTDEELRNTLRRLPTEDLGARSRSARSTYEARFSPDRIMRTLIDVYEDAVAMAHS